jgi:hypothetical protein
LSDFVASSQYRFGHWTTRAATIYQHATDERDRESVTFCLTARQC